MPGAICEIVSIENNDNDSDAAKGIRIDNTAFGGALPLGRWVRFMYV